MSHQDNNNNEDQKPNGPGDSRPTALDIIHRENLEGKLSDKVILITGCSSGIGTETARALAVTGATLFLGVRDMEKGRRVLCDLLSPETESQSPVESKGGQLGSEVQSGTESESTIQLLHLDLASLSSIRTATRTLLTKTTKLNILILNGGVMSTPANSKTVDGFELQFGTNHLGHFLLFQLLQPLLVKSSMPDFHSRVVAVTSSGHRMAGIQWADINFEGPGRYNPRLAYAQSKTANIYMMNEIERRYGSGSGSGHDSGNKKKGRVHGLSVHPGGIFTGLQKFVSDDVLDKLKEPETFRYMKSPEQGAATTVLAAVGKEWEGVGGKYLEDCKESGPARPDHRNVDPGYAEHAFDQESAMRLWEVSLKMVGLA